MNRAHEKDWVFMRIAQELASLSTCRRRLVGCVLTDTNQRIIGTGFNGVPRGYVHCTVDTPCPGVNLPTGTGLELCQSIHAEQNALIHCRNNDQIHIAYCTTAPCMHCVKILLNTNCNRIIFRAVYGDEAAENLWRQSGRGWTWLV
jgi:dCMP deaminase